MTVDELQVLITANTTQLKKEINAVQKDLNGITKNTNKFSTSMTKSFLKSNLIMKTLSLGLNSIRSNLDSAIQRADTINNFSKVMGNLGIATDDSDDSIQRLSDKLTGLPTTLDSAVSAVQRFTSANGNVKASTDMFLALNNAILAGGANQQTQATALEQLSQAYAKGKPDMMEWRTAMTAMPAQLKQVAIAMGYANSSQLGEELRNGSVSMNEFMQTIYRLNTEGVNGFASFEEQAKGSTGGIQTSMTNVKTAITRGIADIINAIGRSNIAGFFQGVAKAINNAVPYITAFVKACIWAINSVSKVFGGGNIIDTKEANKAVNNVNNSVKNLDSSNKSATKSAKETAKALNSLAGFDEMNVLTEKSSSGSDNSDSSGGSVEIPEWDTSSWDTSANTLSSKAEEIAKSIQEKFASIGAGIDFSKLITAFNNLKKAIEPITSKIWDGLKWAYDNILKPLATWSINDFVPAFLNGVSGALKFLNPFLESFMKLGGWLWDNFLSPIAAWTGGVIVDVLNGTGDALGVIGDWASKNQGVIDAMVTTFATFFGLWKLTELLAFIQMSGGLVSAFKSIKTAIELATVAKIKDKLETMYLTALYAKDFVVSLAQSTAEMIKQIGQWALLTGAKALDAVKTGIVTAAQTIWNALSVAGTAVTTALGAAFNFLCSPITLVVLAVAAVVAIVILCIKYWDEIKEVAKKCWDGIKNVWNTVAEWFSTNVIDPIKNFFTGLWDGIKNIFTTVVNWIKENWQALLLILVNPFAGAFKLIYDNCEGFRTVVDNVVKAIKEFFSGLWTKIKDIFSTVGTWFKDKFNSAVTGIKNVFASIGSFFSGIWTTIKNVFSSVKSWFSSIFSGAWDGIKTAFSKVKSFFTGIWDTIKGIFSKVGTAIADAVGGTVKKAINTVLSVAVKIINGFISAINLAISAINLIPGVDIKKLDKLEVPKLARGGIIDKPTIAMVGEAGKEAVMPLERNTGWIDQLASKLGDKIGGAAGDIRLVVKLGEEAIFDRFIEYGKQKAFETNGEVVFI